MGLSNEERYEKILFAINATTDLMADFYDYTTKKLKSLVGRLWYAFLKSESNSLMWIMGADVASDHLGSGLLGSAFRRHIPRHPDEVDTDDHLVKNKFFDSYKVLSGFFDMDRLLEREKRAVFLTYAQTQQISYALCRYRDKFMKTYKDLNFLIRQIQGECFKIMKQDREYAYAWMVHHLCNKIYTMDENDIVNQWWTKHCISHDVKLRYDKYDEVFEAFKKHQFKALTVQERIDLTFLVMADKYGEFEHQHKEFLAMVNTYNKVKSNKVKIKVKNIEEAFEKAKAIKKAAVQHNNIYCEFTGNYVNSKGEVVNRKFY